MEPAGCSHHEARHPTAMEASQTMAAGIVGHKVASDCAFAAFLCKGGVSRPG